MKYFFALSTAALVALAGNAHAGGLAPVIEEQQEIVPVAPTGSGASAYVVPLLLLALLAVASSSSDTAGSGTAGAADEGPRLE